MKPGKKKAEVSDEGGIIEEPEMEEKVGKIDVNGLRKLINKKAGNKVAYSLLEPNPSDQKLWISTGSTLLDLITSADGFGGIPVGRISAIEGVNSSGKSFMAGKICANAQKQGIQCFYFDSESAIQAEHMENLGISLEDLVYVQISSLEETFEIIESLIAKAVETNTKHLYVIDSLAFAPVAADLASQFDPLSSMAAKARVLALSYSKLIVPLANSQCTLLVLNQLKENITADKYEKIMTPYKAPGGMSGLYAYSLRLWLTPKRNKDSFVRDGKERIVGIDIKADVKKSRFGTQGRSCHFQICFDGDKIGILDELSWQEPVEGSEFVVAHGGWKTLTYKGFERKYQSGGWLEELKNEKFKEAVLAILREQLVVKYGDGIDVLLKRDDEAADEIP